MLQPLKLQGQPLHVSLAPTRHESLLSAMPPERVLTLLTAVRAAHAQPPTVTARLGLGKLPPATRRRDRCPDI